MSGTVGHSLKWIIGIVFASAAVALSVMLAVVVFQAATGDWGDGEAGIVWSIAGFVAVLTAVAWAVAVPTIRSALHDGDSHA
jgi:hypothetical protein